MDNTPLLISEVKVLLSVQPRQNPSCKKTLEYCTRFSKYNQQQKVTQIRAIGQGQGLEDIELVQLANLYVTSTEEAIALIPSLSKVNDLKLQQIIDDLVLLGK